MRVAYISKRASKKLEKLLEYLELKWSSKIKMNFVKKFDKSIKQIQEFPESTQQTSFVKGLHMLVITKHTSVFYKFNTKSITIVTIFDNRMNPKKLKKEL